MTEQEDDKWRQEGHACEEDVPARGRDTAYQAQTDGGEHPSGGDRIFELHGVILQRRRATHCSEEHIQTVAAVRRLAAMPSLR